MCSSVTYQQIKTLSSILRSFYRDAQATPKTVLCLRSSFLIPSDRPILGNMNNSSKILTRGRRNVCFERRSYLWDKLGEIHNQGLRGGQPILSMYGETFKEADVELCFFVIFWPNPFIPNLKYEIIKTRKGVEREK